MVSASFISKLVLVVGAVCVSGQSKTRIMELGDSITGSPVSTPNSYTSPRNSYQPNCYPFLSKNRVAGGLSYGKSFRPLELPIPIS